MQKAYDTFHVKLERIQLLMAHAGKIINSSIITGYSQAQEIMENLENHPKKFHVWKNHGLKKHLNIHEKIMEFCEII